MFEQALRELAGSAGAAARPPEFGDLRRRGRRRRWRRRAAGGAAGLVACVVVAVAVLATGSPTAGPVQHPTPTPSVGPALSRHYLITHPAALVNQADAHVLQASYADADHAAALWEVCSAQAADGSCPEVLTWTSDAWSHSRAMVIPDKVAVYPLLDGSVVVWLYGRGFVAEPGGGTHQIELASGPVAAAPGGPLTNLPGVHGGSPAGMFDARTHTLSRPLSSPGTRCVYDDQWDATGTIWEYGAPHCGHEPHLAWSSDLGRTWSTRRTGPVIGLAVAAHRTAVLVGGTQHGGHRTPGALLVTSDGGRSWRRDTLPAALSGTPSVTATEDGRLFLTADAKLWVGNRAWTRFRRFQPSRFITFAVTAGRGVLVSALAEENRIQVSVDGGHNWHRVTPRPSR